MKMTVLLDSYCWFEYYFGSPKGAAVKKILESGEEVLVSSMNVFEVYRKYLKQNPGEASEKKLFMATRAKVVDVIEGIAALAAELSAKNSELHASHAIVYATAVKNKCRLITGEACFKKLPGVEFI